MHLESTVHGAATVHDVKRQKRIAETLDFFADELSAHRFLELALWPEGISCPRCGRRDRIGRLNGSSTRIGTFKCYSCRRTFSLTHGTLFSASHVPLHKWLQAIYLTKGGTEAIKPHHLQHILSVSFKTASLMLKRLSEAAEDNARSTRKETLD